MIPSPVGMSLRAIRRVDRAIGQRSGTRRILVDALTPVNFVMVAPVYDVMRGDPRVAFYFTASDEPRRMREIYREAPGVQLIHPSRAALMRFDAYVTSDFTWPRLPRGACRIQMFHGVAGKYGFDAPTESMRSWDRLFFINKRRLGNFVASGAIDADSPAIRLIGMPKADRVVDGSIQREPVLHSLGLDPALATVLYAPTRSPESSLNALGEELIRALGALPINLIVKLHDRQRDLRHPFSGGVDWVARIQPLLSDRVALAPGGDISPYLVASDLMITDHSSAGFEFLLRDRPLVRIHRPALLERANIHPDYVRMLASASQSVETVAETLEAVQRGLEDPGDGSAARRAIAAELFYRPGTATARSVEHLYEAIDLAAPGDRVAREDSCRLSA